MCMWTDVACKSSVDIMSHVSIQALLSSTIQDRSSMLEAHMVSANSRYIEEQQEQQQVDRQQCKKQFSSLWLLIYNNTITLFSSSS